MAILVLSLAEELSVNYSYGIWVPVFSIIWKHYQICNDEGSVVWIKSSVTLLFNYTYSLIVKKKNTNFTLSFNKGSTRAQ